MKTKNAIALFVVLLLGLQCLGQVDPMQLVNQTPAQRMTLLLDDYLFGGSAISVKYADTLKLLADQYDDEDLLWEAKLIEVVNLTRRSNPDPSIQSNTVELVLTKLLAEAVKNNVWWLTIRLHSMLGKFYIEQVQDSEKGIEHYIKAAKLLESVPTKDYPLKPYFYYQYGFMHYRFGEFRSALDWLEKTREAAIGVDFREHYQFHTCNTTGLCYKFLGNLESAEYCFEKNLKLADSLQNRAWFGISSGNLGAVELAHKNYEKAIPLILVDVEVAEELGDLEMVRNGYIGLGQIALEQGDLKKAKEYLYKAKPIAHELGQIEALGLLYPLLSKLEAKLNNAELSEMYLDSSLIIVGMQYDQSTGSKVTMVEENLEVERLNQSVSKTQWQRNVVGISLTVSVLLALFILFRLRNRSRKRESAIVKEKKLTEKELKNTETKLNQLMISLKSKNEDLANAQLQLDKLKNSLHTDEEKIELTDKLQSIVILTEQDWRDFQILFEKLHPEFLDRLKVKFPDLTRSEVRFAALKRLSLSDGEMADMLGVGNGTIRSLRSRMKPKLNMKEGVDLDVFLKSI